MQYLNLTSSEALEYIKNNNVFLTGPPGSGKSYLTKQYIEYCLKTKTNNEYVGISASTGIAGKILGGYTIHSLSGIGIVDSKTEYSSVFNRVKNNRRSLSKWKKMSVLIIDEISLLDMKTFSFLDKVGRDVRNIDKPFGGIRLLVVGDFFQLPPVNGKYAFKYDEWENVFDFGINLTNIYRSNDNKLNKILKYIRKGKQLNDKMIEQLQERVSENEEYPVLVPLKYLANNINSRKLKENKNEEVEFTATYYYDKKKEYLKDTITKMCPYQEKLILKPGCPVINLVNDPLNGIVNGQIGKYIKLDANGIIVNFDDKLCVIKKHMWQKELPEKELIAMEQYPVNLCYSITIHKSQGQTLTQASMVLNKNVWEKGQGYVALSRLQSLDGLYLLDFHPDIFKVDKSVKKYYKNFKK